MERDMPCCEFLHAHEALIAQGGAYAALWRKQCADADADAKGGMLLA